MLTFGYGMMIAQNYAFLRGIEIDPKKVPHFDHSLAERSHGYTTNFHIANSYGLFRQMTGVRGGRPELIIQGSNDYSIEEGAGTWRDYQFHYKPSDT